MTYAIESINNQSDLLSGVELGYEIRNACDDEDIILWTMMTMTTSVGKYEYTETCPNQTRTNTGAVIGIVGPDRSTSSIIAAKAGRVVTVPIVSHYATSDELSDFERFPFFFRTVPPDKFQVKVIVDILQHFNWKYIALFYSLNSYGIHGARQIIRLAEMYDICIAINLPVASPASEREIADIAQRLSEHDKVTVIVSFTQWGGALAVLEAARKLKASRTLTFIGSDAWNPTYFQLQAFADVLVGGIFIQFHTELPDAFKEYYSELPKKQQQATNYSFRFDENGEVHGSYQVNNWQIKNGAYDLINVGKWDSHQETHLNLEENEIQWRIRDGKVPISLCNEECKPGYIEVPLEKKCCWGCQKCNDYAIVANENNAPVCQDCPVTEWPNDDFKACVPIQPSFISYSNPVFILSIAGAGLGLILTALAAAGLCYYSEHSLIKASSIELCCINLIGLGFSASPSL
ncbi:metabotropic glutamate receptor 8-like [Amphiura filiformis]|uniref:metabotropic glutamate receptor 8-like n=1 Tax=Amphiura filiformis TaxID=82378 RepID=UPI003B2137EA